ncbi:MAG: YajQ family cyclic di-GMP-binding protein [Verrucomicrobiota bacterium]|nr:YajQ family cyclic di-GMP-binding protein [Verrucomicrobiota bacterium]
MPTFDIVSKIDMQEVDNALNQARKEIATRFDFKAALAEVVLDKTTIKLSAIDNFKLEALREVVIGKLAKRNVSLKNLEHKDTSVSSVGRATAEIIIKQGIEHDKAKEITQVIKDLKLKVTSKLQDQQLRVEGKNRDDLQAVMGELRQKDFGIALNFVNFRD